jgi:radical SAM-linked protein
MARSPEGPPPPPAVQKLRVRYAKRGRLRFTSHRDIQRSLERALRRGDIPMAYSAGFSPHPKVSYAGAAPTGTASEAEYLEISVTARCDPAAVRAALDESMPPGLDILEVVEAGPGGLVERLEASVWRIELPGVTDESAGAAVATFLAASEVPVQRMMKNGLRTFDTRSAVHTLAVEQPDRGSVSVVEGSPNVSCAILRAVVRHTTPAVRPDDVLTALRVVADLVPPLAPRVTRLAQGPLESATGAVADPLEADRLRPARSEPGAGPDTVGSRAP